MHHPPRLIQLVSDPRVGALIGATKPVLVLDREGRLLFANRASLALLRSASAADAEATITAERNRIAATLRQVLEAPRDATPQIHALAFVVAGARRAFEFVCSRLPLGEARDQVLLVGREPAGDASEPREALFALVDSQRDAYALVDADGRRVHANPAASALLGGNESIADAVPGIQRALATARSEGAAEFAFGVLRVNLLRMAIGPAPLFLVGFLAPDREPEPGPAVSAPLPPKIQLAPPEAAMDQTERAAIPPASSTTDAAPDSGPGPTQPSRQPGRFVWQTDADGRFVHVSPELAMLVGEELAAIEGLDWSEAGTLYEIEGTEAVVAAMARRDTWSGVAVAWPVGDTEMVRPVDLAALPVFDRDRRFLGYRGFGVFREAQSRRKPKADRPRVPEAAPREFRAELPASVRGPVRPAVSRPLFAEKPENVVPLHQLSDAEGPERPTLTAGERQAFREIARAIGARMKRVDIPANDAARDAAAPRTPPSARSGAAPVARIPDSERSVLDRLPLGLIVHRGDKLLYANRSLLEWVGVASVDELTSAGGLDRLFSSGRAFGPEEIGEGARPIAIRGRGGEPIPVEARLLSVPWEGEAALIYILRRAGAGLDERMEASELAMRELEAAVREMRAILDTATDGVALIDRDGRVLGMNRSAEALFGFDSAEVEGRHFTALFAPESHRAATDYLDGLAVNGVASVLNDGREVIGRVREGGLIPLFMTLGRVGDGGDKFCAVFRDITQWKRAEEDLVHARRSAEQASSAKSEFLAKISHEIRTPLNAIIGFAEVMMEERLGPILNERYREYLKDIHASGEHLVSLINDLLDLSKIEAGKLDLAFSSVDLNEIASQSMALMQPQANRERIIIRTALSPDLPPVVADARSIRQIVLNLLSNSIRFTPPGGQVIVSTTLTDHGEVHLRVRDTGIGMTEAEIKTALEPFRQIATSGRGKQGGTGLGLPLTKALVEANRASFSIKSTVNAGTLVEIAFPSTRVLAE